MSSSEFGVRHLEFWWILCLEMLPRILSGMRQRESISVRCWIYARLMLAAGNQYGPVKRGKCFEELKYLSVRVYWGRYFVHYWTSSLHKLTSKPHSNKLLIQISDDLRTSWWMNRDFLWDVLRVIWGGFTALNILRLTSQLGVWHSAVDFWKIFDSEIGTPELAWTTYRTIDQ